MRFLTNMMLAAGLAVTSLAVASPATAAAPQPEMAPAPQTELAPAPGDEVESDVPIADAAEAAAAEEEFEYSAPVEAIG